MGVNASKNKSNLCDRDVTGLMENIRFLQKAMREMTSEREKQSKAYERDMMVFAFKEAEWEQERKRLREEVMSLRKMVEEKEDRIKEMGEKSEIRGWELLMGSSFLVEQMRKERARRDEAVGKWKQLYLAIKMELDDLIQRTHHGTSLFHLVEVHTCTRIMQKCMHSAILYKGGTVLLESRGRRDDTRVAEGTSCKGRDHHRFERSNVFYGA
ncbi:hypothetical protein I3843_02G089100 [Carya illinoinensis]|nr:hypothetical protein I3843_02G089100 [Carya illinoinensis]